MLAAGAGAMMTDLAALARLARVDLSDPGELTLPDRTRPESGRGGAGQSGASRRNEADPLAVLTAREREVLAHLLAGRTYAEIARALFISQKTVGVHVSNLLRKTGTANRTAAAVWARRQGVVPAADSAEQAR